MTFFQKPVFSHIYVGHPPDQCFPEVENLENKNLIVCSKYRVAIIELLPLFYLLLIENGYVTHLALGRRNLVINCVKMMKFNPNKRS